MSGGWIKVERATPDKPETLRIARELCIDRDAVFGKLMLLWMWFDANSVDGHVDGAVDADVDALVRHQGFATVLRTVKWLRDTPRGVGLCMPNFDRHNGESAKKRALSNRRQTKWRNASVDGDVDGSALQPRLPEKIREEKKNNKEKTSAVALPAWVPEDAWNAWLEVRPKVKAPNTRRALNLALRDLQKLRDEGNDPRAVLEAAVVKGWRGLFPVAKPKAKEEWHV
jgi:hypothetical protein